MKLQLNRASAVLVVGAIVCGAPTAAAAPARIPAPWKNCKQVNSKYPHGVGRRLARDKTSGTPVTTFRRSNFLYRIAMRYHPGLDRDKDGIACEKL
jgi:hypothetical protein